MYLQEAICFLFGVFLLLMYPVIVQSTLVDLGLNTSHKEREVA